MAELLEQRREFENLVISNQQWLLRYVQKTVRSCDVAEDIVQETFMRAYKAYDGYQERGLQREWLRTIARNVTMRYFQTSALNREISWSGTDADVTYEDFVDTAPSVEEQAIWSELTQRILGAMAGLPEAQCTVEYYRFIKDLSVHQVACLTHQPLGSVKSRSHYSLAKVRQIVSQYVCEEEFSMSCRDAYALLYQYAKGQIMPSDKEKVETHLSVCETCDKIASSLRLLAPHITPAGDHETRHYMIVIPLPDGTNLHNFGMTFPMDDHEHLNTLLRQRKGIIPEGETWFGTGHDADFDHIAEFDNEGHKIEFELVPNANNPNNVRVKYRKMLKIYPNHTVASVGLRRSKHFISTIEDPNLMIGKLQNNLGTSAKSGLYLAIPATARNIRTKRGNGVIDAGSYKFAFTERYIADDEAIRLECSYLKG